MVAEASTMDALQAARRADTEPLTPLPSEEPALPPDEPDQGE